MRDRLKLTPIRRRVLARLVTRDIDLNGCESASEIAKALGEPKVSSRAAATALVDLDIHGLAKHVGFTMSNARTWTATDAGREAHSAPPDSPPPTTQAEGREMEGVEL